MHYIRILKAPRVLPGSPAALGAKITITTDLGEAFLRDDVRILVELEDEAGGEVLGMGKGKEYTWKGKDGMRSLEVVIPIPIHVVKGKRKIRMMVRASDARCSADTFESVLYSDEGCVVAVRSLAIDLQPGASQQQGLAERVFTCVDGGKQIHIWEETGESIARHIWYAAIGPGQVRPPSFCKLTLH